MTVNPSEQAAFAPFLGLRTGRKAPAHRESFGFERRERRRDFSRLNPERRGERGLGDWPQPLQSPAQDFDQRLLARPFLLTMHLGRGDRRVRRPPPPPRPLPPPTPPPLAPPPTSPPSPLLPA